MIGDPVHPVPLRAPGVTVIAVDYDDPAAGALRRAMVREMGHRYADRGAEFGAHAPALSVAPGTVAYTALAITGDGLPIGHLALRRAGDDVELKRMYVVPPYRGTGAAVALLRAAEEAARTLRVRRIILQTGDRQPDAVRLYERHGYTPIPVFPPYEDVPFSRCYQKAMR
ncbi:GNAT family N-acetyltransferase [Actinoallomurus bryophytorum]|uniref:Acetyltransferase (GNAT) family protein n=1 Tax=Actinoallomurus bryophytorum TaxID=1490222 RepID=A0A543CUH5_9ACTN|nr:GNAT family N-acetyltransferase [Actinoallomurus bryophytorum]TQM00518.1 acetyltransferase (GNAT) family protein [Actinoallomurus bryophytorum]